MLRAFKCITTFFILIFFYKEIEAKHVKTCFTLLKLKAFIAVDYLYKVSFIQQYETTTIFAFENKFI